MNENKSILLASSSPRRVELMEWLNVPFTHTSPELDESSIRHPSPGQLTKLLAEAKAESLVTSHPNTLIIGSDTLVYFQGNILEKPRDKQHQKEMMHQQSGQRVEAYSSLCIVNPAERIKIVKTKITSYRVATLSDEQIDQYVASRDGLGKAGGFGIQDRGGLFIEAINGCYTGVVGLALCDAADSLQQLGVAITVDIRDEVFKRTNRAC